jgi:hypothetical protein
MVRLYAGLAVVGVLANCPSNTITTFTPSATAHTSFVLKGGTIDGNGPCNPPTPPSRPDPPQPALGRVEVGYSDWRNTLSDASGNQCKTSNAKRFEGMVNFDMTGVASDLNASPFKTVTGTLTYHSNSAKIPQSPSAIDLCVANLRLAAAPWAAGSGLVALNFIIGQNFPASSAPSLGPINIPGTAPIGQITNTGGVTVDPAGPEPTVSVDVTTMLSDWVATKPSSLSIVFVPQGPTLASMGLNLGTPDPQLASFGVGAGTPVPASRSTAECISVLKDFGLTVHVGR